MMRVVEFTTPVPYCLIPVYHRYRDRTPAIKTDIRRLFREVDPRCKAGNRNIHTEKSQ